VISSVR